MSERVKKRARCSLEVKNVHIHIRKRIITYHCPVSADADGIQSTLTLSDYLSWTLHFIFKKETLITF